MRKKTIKLTPATIRAGASPQSFARGEALYQNDALAQLTRSGQTIRGLCEGSEEPFYSVNATLDAGGVVQAQCSCPFDYPGYCKHIVAILLAYAADAGQFSERADLLTQLAALDHERLLALFQSLLDDVPEMNDWLVTALAEAQPATPKSPPKPDKQRMASAPLPPAKRKQPDLAPHRRRIRSLLPSGSEGYGFTGGLVPQLDDVVQTARDFLQAGDAETALGILLILFNETVDIFERVDDSDGDLGEFFDAAAAALAEVILSLARAHELDAGRRAELLSEPDILHAGLDDYGVSALALPIAAVRDG